MDKTEKIKKAIARVLPYAKNSMDVDEIQQLLESKEGIFIPKELLMEVLKTLG